MGDAFRRLDDELTTAEPTPELLLQLAPILPPEAVSRAIDIVFGMGPDPVTVRILANLVMIASEEDRARLESILENQGDLLATEVDIIFPFRDSLASEIAELEESERAALVEPLLDQLRSRFMPAMANGGGGGETANGHGGETANGHGGETANGHGDEEGLAGGPGGALPPRRPRVVSTGFADPATPKRPLPKREPLEPGTDYVFWLEIGRPVRGSIEEAPEEVLPEEQLEAGARIRVVVFPFPGELALDSSAREGELVLDADGQFSVARQPGGAPTGAPPAAGRRLFFPLSTPAKPGSHRLRCNLYFRNVLVQSRLVTAAVGQAPPNNRPALSAAIDYRRARMLSGAELGPIREHALSIQLNSNGADTHQFRFFGEDGAEAFVEDATISENALADLIKKARGELRKASWGSVELFTDNDRYRYLNPAAGQFEADLFAFMARGFRIYDVMINELTGGSVAADKLAERMLKPGRVQIVSHGSPSELVPASLIYDYGNAKPGSSDLKLCPQFLADMAAAPPLEDARCFNGECPSRETKDVVCPSGFWGYRHRLGMPVTTNVPASLPVVSKFDPTPILGMAVNTDLALAQQHADDLADDLPGWEIRGTVTFEGTLDMLRSRPHIVYFYVHGGSEDDVPFLRVGNKAQPKLERTDLRLHDPEPFRAPRSLVILNGCRTTALEPDRAVELVSAFVQNVGSLGVIGTEVTVFEELATVFGAELLRHLRGGTEVGEAVRRARLLLLKQGNPLGLVYVPFVAADARLVGPN